MDQNSIMVAYARVSSTDDRQKLGLEIQEKALEGCNYIFKEKHSGSDDDRLQLAKAINKAKQLVQDGYKVSFCVYKMDRFSRKTSTLLKIIEELKDCWVEFISIKESVDTSTSTGILMYQLLGIFAEFELNNLKQRTREGLAQAKANGVKLGNQGSESSVEQEC